MACSHFKCLISYCVLGTSVPCRRGAWWLLAGREIFLLRSPPCCHLQSSRAGGQHPARSCLSVNLRQNKSPSPGFGLRACFSSPLAGAAASRHRGREPLESEIKRSGNPLGPSLCLRAGRPAKGPRAEGGEGQGMAAVRNKDRLCHLCHRSGSARSLRLFCLAPSAAAGVILADGPACNCESSSPRARRVPPAGRARFKLKGFKSLCTCQ